MLDRLRQMAELRKQAKDLKNNLAQEIVTGKGMNGKVSIEMDGNQEVIKVEIAEEAIDVSEKNILEEGIKEAFKSAQKEIQRNMINKLQSGQMQIPNFMK